jgi:hypothetical protein
MALSVSQDGTIVRDSELVAAGGRPWGAWIVAPATIERTTVHVTAAGNVIAKGIDTLAELRLSASRVTVEGGRAGTVGVYLQAPAEITGSEITATAGAAGAVVASAPLVVRDSKLSATGALVSQRLSAANTMLAGSVWHNGPAACTGLYDANFAPVTC